MTGRLLRLVAAAVLGAAIPDTALAQRREPAAVMLSGMFGTGMIDGGIGLTGGVGAALGTQRYVVRASFDMHLIEPDDSDYSWDLGSDGVECREDGTGQVVDGSLCSISRAMFGVSTDAGIIVPAFRGGIHVGAGYRFGSGSTPYGLLGYGFTPADSQWSLLFRIVGGRDLVGVQAVASVPVGRE